MSLSFAARPILIMSMLLALAPTAGAQTAPETMSKEARHERMIELQRSIDALKPGSSAADRQAFASAQAELEALSASLGGDLPCAVAAEAGTGAEPRPAVAPSAPTGCLPATATFSNSTPTPLADIGVTTSTIVVSGANPYLWDLDVTTAIAHTFSADLDITLTSPAGTVVTLTTDNGAGNDNVFDGTVWDDDANPGGQVPYVTNAGLVTDHPYANLTLASPLVPEESLAAYVGEDPNGTWTLTVSDDLAGESGSLSSWSLGLTTFAAAPTASAVQSFDQTTPTAIPTGPAVVTSTLAVSGLTAPVCNAVLRTPSFPHTFAADLDITLTSPTGTVVTLSTDNGAGNDNVFNGTVWNDDANPLGQVPYTTNNGMATDNAYVNLTTATPLVPEESMGAFMGEDGNGTWTVTVSDDLAGDGGSFTWGLDLITCSCPSTADVSVTATDSPDPVVAGNNLTYVLTTINGGPVDAAALTLATSTPAGTTFVSLTAPTLTCTTPAVGASGAISCTAAAPTPAAGSHVATLVVAVSPAAASGSLITLNATAGSSTTDPNAANNSTSIDTTVTTSADLTITKTDGTATATPGGSTTYTIVAGNAGPSDAPGTQLVDTFPAECANVSWTCAPAGTATCTGAGSGNINDIVSLPSGTSVTYIAACTIAAAANGNLINTATVTGTPPDPNPANNSATDTDTLVANADLALTVTDAPDPVTAGSNLVYNASLTNNGLSSADTAALSIPLPANTTFVSGTASAGGSCVTPAVGAGGTVTCTWAGLTAAGVTRTLALTAQVSAAAVGSLTTTATASSTTGDANAANNSVLVSTSVGSAADLSISLTDSPDPVTAGTDLTYTATVANNGPSDAQAVQIATSTPTNTTFVSATPSAGGSCTSPAVGGTGAVTCTWAGATATGVNRSVVFVVRVAASASGTIGASATASSTTGDSNAANNTAAASTTVGGTADLSMSLTDSPDPVTAGTNLTYTATATNSGPSDAQAVQIATATPTGTTFVSATPGAGGNCTSPAVGGTGPVVCTWAGSTASGMNRSVAFVVRVAASASGTINASATASATTSDSNAANNTAAASTTTTASADLGITLGIAPATVTQGSLTTITATATNAGPSDAQGVQVTVILPAEMGYASVNPGAGGTCITPAAGAGGAVICTYAGATAAGSSRTVIVTAVVYSGSTVTATVTSSTPDPAAANGSASGSVVVGGIVVSQPAIIPTLGRDQMLLLGLMLGLIGTVTLGRRG